MSNTRAYIIRSTNTGVMTPRVIECVHGRENALRRGRELSTNGREVTVRRRFDGHLVRAFHSGQRLDASEVYIDDFAHMGEEGDTWSHLVERPSELTSRS